MNRARNITNSRLFLVVFFSLLSVVGSVSVAAGDLLNAPKSGPSRYGQLREAATYLRDEAGITSHSYRRQVIESFGPDLQVTNYSGQAYQYSGFSGTASRYITPTPLLNPVQQLALPPSNPATLLQQYSVAPTRVLSGSVAPQNFGVPLNGGAQQMFIPSRSVLSPTPLLQGPR